MTTPLDYLDLPDIDEQLSEHQRLEQSATYEPHPFKESDQESHSDKDESLQVLERKITQGHIPRHDVVNPTGHEQDALFPEEYQVETETGLVRSTTALSLQRSRSRQISGGDKVGPLKSNTGGGLTKEKLDRAVERNKKALERKNEGLWQRLKGLFGKHGGN